MKAQDTVKIANTDYVVSSVNEDGTFDAAPVEHPWMVLNFGEVVVNDLKERGEYPEDRWDSPPD